MQTDPMPTDATLLTLHGSLDDPTGYVRAVLERLWACKRQNGDAQVRISIRSGTGAPDYRIETIMDEETGHSVMIDAFSGKTHRPLAYKKADDYRLWSDTSVSLEEVAALLGALRRFKPKGVRNA